MQILDFRRAAFGGGADAEAAKRFGGAAAERKQRSACCARAERKRSDALDATRTPETQAPRSEPVSCLALGFLRKALAGTVFLLHPLVATTAFKSVYV